MQYELAIVQGTDGQGAEVRGSDRRATDPLSRLGRQWDRQCREAVAPGEIMVALEAAGLNDAVAREKYGCVDLMDCAERLYRQVPFRPDVQVTPTAPHPPPWLPLLRGVTYLLPAAWLPLTTQVWGVQAASVGWVTATMFCWGWGQLVAYLGYSALGRCLPEQAALLVRLLSAVGVALTALAALVAASVLGTEVIPTLATALLTATYIFSAYALLVHGRTVALLLLSLPAAAAGLTLEIFGSAWVADALSGALHALVAAPSVQPGVLVAGVLAYAALAPLAAALFVTRRVSLSHWPARDGVVRAFGHALYGWSCATFLAWATFSAAQVVGLSGLAASLVLVPLVLSMGVMEVVVERLLLRLRALASLPLTLEGLIGNAQRALLTSVLVYTASLVALHLVMAQIATVPVPTAHVVGQTLFGVAAMVSAVLLQLDRLWMVVGSWMSALALLVLLSLLPAGDLLGSSGLFLLDIEALLFGLVISLAVTLYDINSYR